MKLRSRYWIPAGLMLMFALAPVFFAVPPSYACACEGSAGEVNWPYFIMTAVFVAGVFILLAFIVFVIVAGKRNKNH